MQFAIVQILPCPRYPIFEAFLPQSHTYLVKIQELVVELCKWSLTTIYMPGDDWIHLCDTGFKCLYTVFPQLGTALSIIAALHLGTTLITPRYE